jgi:hypothetical protein
MPLMPVWTWMMMDGLSDYDEFLANSNPIDSGSDNPTTELMVHTFEDNVFPLRWWRGEYGDVSWQTTSLSSKTGQYSFTSGPVQPDEYAEVKVTNRFAKGWLNFDYKVVAQSDDRFIAYVGNTNIVDRLGASDWRRTKTMVIEGRQDLYFRFFKYGKANFDAVAFIDNVVFIAFDSDVDGDGMQDQWEYDNGLDFNNANDGSLDNDNDGLTNQQE